MLGAYFFSSTLSILRIGFGLGQGWLRLTDFFYGVLTEQGMHSALAA
jgi:hypothetical protein